MKEKIKIFLKRWHRLIQLGITILLFYLLFKKFQLDACLGLLEKAHASFLIAGLVVLALGQVWYGFAWHSILKILGHSVGVGRVINVFFQSLFVNNFATFVGGDVYRGVKIFHAASSKFDVGFSLVLSRFLMLYSIVWIAGAACFFWGHFLNLGSWFKILGLSVFLMSTLILIGFRYFHFKMINSYQSRLGRFVQKFSGRASVIQENYYQSVMVFFINVLGHFCGFVVIWLFAKSIDISMDFWQVILFLSIIRLVIILPITVNGLGLREAGFIGLLTRLGFQNVEALSLGLLASMATILISFFGGLLLLWDSLRVKTSG